MIRAILHKFRGGCAYCGAQRLRQACIHLEDYLLTEKIELREKLFKQFVDEINKVIVRDYY